MLQQIIGLTSVLLLLIGCSAPAVAPTPVPPTVTLTPPRASTSTTTPADELSDEKVATLSSLEQVDDYPLYTMHYYGAYEETVSSVEVVEWTMNTNVPHSDLAASPRVWA